MAESKVNFKFNAGSHYVETGSPEFILAYKYTNSELIKPKIKALGGGVFDPFKAEACKVYGLGK